MISPKGSIYVQENVGGMPAGSIETI